MDQLQSDLASRALASGLVTRQQLDDCRARLGQSDDERRLIELLVGRSILTRWHVAQLRAGRSGGFHLKQYRLQEPLGVGGMGQVFRALDTQLGRQVAVKVLPAKAATPEAVGRFRREALAALQMQHENIVQTFELGQQGASHFLVMELVEGSNLRQYLARQGVLSVRATARIGYEVALALEHARGRGIVHRDIKPSNIMLTRQGRVKLADLGLAKFFGDTENLAAEITRTGQLMGTIDYLAPEQAADSRRADTRSDVYSLGCTLYECLTGHAPFADESAVQKILSHRERLPDPIVVRNPKVPLLFSDLIEKRMLPKRPEDRFQTPAELALALQSWAVESGGATGEPSAWAGLSNLLNEVAQAEQVASGGSTGKHALGTLPAGKRKRHHQQSDLWRGPLGWALLLVLAILLAAFLLPHRGRAPGSGGIADAPAPPPIVPSSPDATPTAPSVTSGGPSPAARPTPGAGVDDTADTVDPKRKPPNWSQSSQEEPPSGSPVTPAVPYERVPASDRRAARSTAAEPRVGGPPPRPELELGAIALFDGQSLQGFKSRGTKQIQDEVLTLRKAKIESLKQYGRFKLSITFRLRGSATAELRMGRFFNVSIGQDKLTVDGKSRGQKAHASLALVPEQWQSVHFEGSERGLSVSLVAPASSFPNRQNAFLPDGSRSSQLSIEVSEGDLEISDLRIEHYR